MEISSLLTITSFLITGSEKATKEWAALLKQAKKSAIAISKLLRKWSGEFR